MSSPENEKIYYEPDGRAFRKERFTNQHPRYTFVSGKFVGKFYSDLQDFDCEREEFYNFKIYEAEVEIVDKSKFPPALSKDDPKRVVVNPSQMPEKVLFYEVKEGKKVYYDLKFENPLFHNFKFVHRLQQNEGKEAFGTIEAEFYGHLIDFVPEERYRKRYKHINLVKQEVIDDDNDCIKTAERTGKIERKENAYREEYFCQGKQKTFWGDWIDGVGGHPPPPLDPPPPQSTTNRFSPCLVKLILSILLTIFSLILGITPLFIIGLIWLLYVVYKCYFNWIKYLAYLFGILFLIGLIYSIINTDWHRREEVYIPHPVQKTQERPQLVKIITLAGDKEDVFLQRSITWYGYNGEKYSGTFSLNKRDLNISTKFKNSLKYEIGYNSVIYNISKFDSDKLGGVYKMFDQIKAMQKLNDKQFAEMVVSFVQYMPYYVVLEGGCNANEYADRNTKELLKQYMGKCAPHNKFGITTPLEFLATSQGDCDSRTVLLYTIFKHYHYNVAVLSSEVYMHSLLGISLPYNGLTYDSDGGHYVLWETTDRGFKPGLIPNQIINLNNWEISLK